MNAATRGLAEANRAFAAQYPGESGARQPVHTVYGGAHLFRARKKAADRWVRREVMLQ